MTATYQGKTATAHLVVTAGAPATVTVTSGDMQSAATGQTFATRLGVKVIDSYGNAVPNTEVTFAVASGAASFAGGASTTVRTGTDGLATAPVLTAGTETGPVVVTATARTASVAFLETVTVVGTGKADLKMSLSAPLTARRGQEITVTATVSNAGTGPAGNVRTVVALPRGFAITDPGGGTVRGSLVLGSTPTLSPGQQATFTIKAKVPSAAARWAWVGSVTGSASKESSYRNNGAFKLIAIR